ncbi:MAG: hypothetical protein CVU12_05325 [Bacteroidetes bacterium HGW-Bacteroidetes-7]|nr:MAG: hypothetical protein CVU12_05325 [Bacteroidetes bacterium HGW-Bacteroidetes-7]
MNKIHMALLTTAYLPPVDYFRVIARADKWEIEQWEKYQKQSYRSRCHILSANGPLSLSIPVDRSGGHSVPIKSIKVDNSVNWQKTHWGAIVSAYQSSPFFEYYKEDFRPFYENRADTLFEFNTALTKLILDSLGLPSDISFTEFFNAEKTVDDFRFSIHPKQKTPFVDANKKGRYHQVFAHKFDFKENLSAIDLLFNEGPESLRYLLID